ncbi:hypothetical protein Ahy_B06g085869 [Arachis hypogaea]|uniref:Uncharacterized protein n=1 Tax=Arachis hypogaea TaxID=3818 RepID=A0A444YVU4_ARAHY|nr:hypothetical protein Ahy_B06g085869 [Arachis hypogaea]
MQLKHRLSSIKIEKSVNEYVLVLKGTIDTLALVGEPMRESDHANTILNGLTKEYSLIITSVVERPMSILVEKLEALLLTHESMLESFQNQSHSYKQIWHKVHQVTLRILTQEVTSEVISEETIEAEVVAEPSIMVNLVRTTPNLKLRLIIQVLVVLKGQEWSILKAVVL